MININYFMRCTESRTDKENNKININPTEIIGEKKMLITKHEGLHYEPLIDPLTPSLYLNCPEHNFYDVFDNVD